MSELSYKELQEQGVFDIPYRAFEYMQSQQAKIDELKMSNHHLSVQLVDSNAHYDHVKKERDELQARIDEALNMLCKLQHSSSERIYNDVGNILKGK